MKKVDQIESVMITISLTHIYLFACAMALVWASSTYYMKKGKAAMIDIMLEAGIVTINDQGHVLPNKEYKRNG